MLKKVPWPIIIPLAIVLFYFFTHLIQLLALPVFADEAIYIRWAQLIMDDWQRYAFFPMNDGKTPLFIWLLIPFQFIFDNQLFAARIVSVLTGAAQLFVIAAITQALGGRRKTQYLAMIFVAVLPFWYFYHRMALMDSLLTFWISLTILYAIRLAKNPKGWSLKYAAYIGISLGLAFWTKLPALFLFPILPLFMLIEKRKNYREYLPYLFTVGSAIFLGSLIFVSLRISPSFGQLFRRGQDFAFPVNEVLFQGKWQLTLANIPSYLNYFATYLTLPVFLLSVAGLFSNRYRRTIVFLLLGATLFALPFVLFGKVIYARYLFPSAIFLTVASVLSLQALYDHWVTEKQKLNWQKIAVIVILVLAIANTLAASAVFMNYALFDPNNLPLLSSDRYQYLEDWSSGHGIIPTVKFIRAEAQKKKIAVATEGRFGTLPDGLLLFFHGKNVDNIYIEGIGQYPVKSIPDFFKEKAQGYDEVFLVVNSNRMEIALPPENLIAQYPRPNHAPSLQIWDITKLVKK